MMTYPWEYELPGVSAEDVLGMPFPRPIMGDVENFLAARDREAAARAAEGPTFAPMAPIQHTAPGDLPPSVNVGVMGATPAGAPQGAVGGQGAGGGYMGGGGASAGPGGPMGGGGAMRAPGGEVPGVNPVDIAKGLKNVYSGANELFDLGLPDLPSPTGYIKDLAGDFFSGGVDPISIDPTEFAGSLGPGAPGAVGAGVVPGTGGLGLADASVLLANEAGVIPGAGGASATAGVGGFFGAGVAPTLGVLGPAALVMGAGAIERMKPPSVGPNYSVRFRTGPDGLRTETGSDNEADPHALQITEQWSRDLLDNVLGDNVTKNLDGALTYFAGGESAGMHAGWGYASGGEQKPFATSAGALKALITANHNQGRIKGDLGALLSNVDAAIEQGGSLEDRLAALREKRLDIVDAGSRQMAADGTGHYVDPRRQARFNAFMGP